MVRANLLGSITSVETLKVLLLAFYTLQTDNFKFKPEMRGWGEISLVQANSQGWITLVGPLKKLLWAFHELTSDNFRFDRKCVGGAQI